MKPHIVCTEDTCWGQPRIRGTRVTVEAVYDLFLAEKRSVKKTARWFGVTEAQVRACVRYKQKGAR